MRRHTVWASMGACLVMLAGCASIPTSGPVQVEGVVVANETPPEPVALVRPPADGATPQEIVTGFLTANAVPTDNYAVARTFLSPEIQESWNPESGAIIYSDGAGYSLASTSTASVTLSAAEEGRLTSDAQYLVSRSNARIDQPFVLRRIDGQWRILELRDGLLLTTRDLARVYGGYDVYYLTPDSSVLVPDRVLLSDRPGVGTTLMRRLLQGPSAWLAPAVTSAVPTGTALAIDATPLADSVMTVDLTEEVLAADDAARNLLAAQIVWTLTALPGVEGVRITVSGQPLSIGGPTNVLTRPQFASLNPNVLGEGTAGYASIGGRLSVLSNTIAPVPGVFGQGSVNVRLAAVSIDESNAGATIDAAALRGTVYVAGLSTNAAPVPRARLESVTSLSFDRSGAAVASGEPLGVVRWLPPGGGSFGVTVANSPNVVRLAMARDGARVALVVKEARSANTALFLARVVREGRQVRFEGLRVVENELSSVIDVAWADADRLAVLAPADNGTTQVFDVVVGDTTVAQRGGIPDMVKVAAAPGSPLLVESRGGIWEESGAQWRRLADGISPLYPG